MFNVIVRASLVLLVEIFVLILVELNIRMTFPKKKRLFFMVHTLCVLLQITVCPWDVLKASIGKKGMLSWSCCRPDPVKIKADS